MAISNDNLKTLLNTASYLNEKLVIGAANTATYNGQISLNSTSVEGNRVILQDIKDAIETKNREYLEREIDIKKNGIPKTTSLQDWSLALLYSGFGLFSLLILIYIFLPSNNVNNAFWVASGYMVLVAIMFVSGMFVIQRYG